MSEFFFDVVSGVRVTDKQGRAINAVAKTVDCTFVWAKMPEGWRYWFATDNIGAPFDQRRAAACREALAAAGIDLPR